MSTPKEEAAINYIWSLQKEQKQIDLGNLRASLSKPLLLDNPKQNLTAAQIRQKNLKRQASNKNRLLFKREKRRIKITPLNSVQLEDELFNTWLAYAKERSKSSPSLSSELCLQGCRLTVVNSLFRPITKKGITGIVLKEGPGILFISCAERKRVYIVYKRGTTFSCQGVEFERENLIEQKRTN